MKKLCIFQTQISLIFVLIMTEELIKESFSIKYLETLATYNGYTTDWPGKDFGRDLTINEISTRTQNEKTRFIETGRTLKIQAKATTENSIEDDTDTSFKYDLEAKTFNDLIVRNNQSSYPLILFVFILPSDKTQWMELNDDNLLLRKNGYWFVPDPSEIETTNSSTKRITINKSNKFTLDTIKHLMNTFN